MITITSPSRRMIETLTHAHDLKPTADGESVYDIKISSVDGSNNDVLADRHGKVSMIVNVTGECGNSNQYPMLQVLEYDYADYGFKIICVPTNDYCEYGYGEFENNSTSTGQQAYEHAYYTYRSRLDFTELVVSRYAHPDEEIEKTPHPLYKRLGVKKINPIKGNFEKWIVSKDGKESARFTNGMLLPANYESGWDDFSPKEALTRIRSAIEYFISKD